MRYGRSWGCGVCLPAALVVLGAAACTSTDKPDVYEKPAVAEGFVTVGLPVVGAHVTAYVDSTFKTKIAPSVTTDELGHYRLPMGTALGRVWMCAEDGTFFDLATGVPGTVAEPWCAVVNAVPETVATQHLTPFNRWTEALARSPLGEAHGDVTDPATLEPALVEAADQIDAFLGCGKGFNLVGTAPIDPTASREAATGLSSEVVAGLALGGLSYQCKMMAESQGKTPGVACNVVTLMDDYADDWLADGIQDGKGEQGQLKIAGGYDLGVWSLRDGPEGLPNAERRFIESDRNQTGVTVDDVRECLGVMAGANGDGGLFMKGAGTGEVDRTAPEVTIFVPTNGSVCAGDVQFRCGASDPSGVAADAIKFSAQRVSTNTPLDQNVFKNFTAATTADGAQASATFDTVAAGGDYEVVLMCTAVDPYGNSTTASVSIRIYNSGTSVKVLSPEPDTELRGDVEIACECHDERGALCELVRPSPAASNVQMLESGPEEAKALWSTTFEAEGSNVVECRGSVPTEPTAPAITDTTPVTINNLDPVGYEGTVTLGLQGATATLVSLGDNSVLGIGVTDEKGTFKLSGDGDKPGPALLRIAGPTVRYKNPCIGGERVLGNASLTLLLNHQPGAAPTEVTDLSANLLSTLAAKFGQGYAASGGIPEEARTLSNLLWGSHVRREDPIDLAHTVPSNFLGEYTGDSDESKLLGLFEQTLCRRAAEMSLAAGREKGAISIFQVMDAVQRESEGDNVLNGLRNGVPVTIEGFPDVFVTTETLRYDLGGPLARVLHGIPLSDGTPAPNLGLDPAKYLSVGGLVDSIVLDDSVLFGVPPQRSFDREPPAISSGTTTTSNVGGTVRVCFNVSDPSGLYSVAFDGTAMTNVTNDGSRICGDVDTVRLGLLDGAFSASVTASDTMGNRRTATVNLDVNNHGPTIVLIGNLPSSISGIVTLRFRITDGNGVAEASVRQPTGSGIQFTRDADDTYTLQWDTMQSGIEGAADIVIFAKDSYGRETGEMFSTEIDNFSVGGMDGTVSVGVPYKGADVEAFALRQDGSVGISLGTARTDFNGAWSLSLSDSYSGWVLVRVTGRTTTYLNVATGETVDAGADELTVLVSYAPSRAGTFVRNLSVHPVTAFADAHAIARIRRGEDATEAINRAYYLWGVHLNKDGLDIRTTLPRDFVSGSVLAVRDTDPSTRLGAYINGISRLGAETAYTLGRTTNMLPTLVMVRHFVRDGGNVLFEGLDVDGAVIRPLDGAAPALTNKTLGNGVAVAAYHFLKNADLCGSPLTTTCQQAAFNRTNDDGTQHAQEHGFFRHLSENGQTTELFGEDHAQLFDVWSPVIDVVELLDDQGRVLDRSIPVAKTVYIHVKVSDTTNVIQGITAELSGAVAPPGAISADQMGEPTKKEARFRVDTTMLPAGRKRFLIKANDGLNPSSEKIFEISVDNDAPTVEITAPDITNSTSLPLTLRVSDPNNGKVRRLEVTGGVQPLVISDPSLKVVTALAIQCDFRPILTATATDAAGNVGSATKQVECDNKAPTAEKPEPNSPWTVAFSQEGDAIVAQYDADGRLVYKPTAVESVFVVDGMNVRKYFNRLDGINNNLPVAKFKVDDANGTVFSHPSELVGEYQYLLNDRVIRPWTQRQPREGIVNVVLSYQDLLPNGATPESNVVQRSTPSDRHRVEVRVTDRAGNVSDVAKFNFTLEVLVPPCQFRGCGPDPQMTAYSLSAGNLDVAYNSNGFRAFRGELICDIDVPAVSLASRDAIKVTVSGGATATHLREFTGDKILSGGRYDPGTSFACYRTNSNRHQWKADGYSSASNCYAGLFASSVKSMDIASNHTRKFLVSRGEELISGSLLGEYPIATRAAHNIAIFLESPRVNDGVGMYSWSSYTTASGEKRYELGSRREGRDIYYTGTGGAYQYQAQNFAEATFISKVSVEASVIAMSSYHPSVFRPRMGSGSFALPGPNVEIQATSQCQGQFVHNP